MLRILRFILLVAVLCASVWCGPLLAQASEPEADPEAMARAFVDSLKFERGDFHIDEAGATLRVGAGFRYLDAPDARRVLEEFWGNPEDDTVLGMVVPETPGLMDAGSWAVVVTYSDDGYISDEDAAEIDYAEIMSEMQEQSHASNEARREAGYPTVEMIGWATPPRYDAASKKIHWAKELAFEGNDGHTVNYDIRVLGRSGYLSLNAIGDMADLTAMESGLQRVIAFTDFDEGRRYADHNPATDKVATYGLAALVGGAIATKAGLFTKLAALLLAGKKLLIPLGIVVVGLFSSVFKRKREAGKSP